MSEDMRSLLQARLVVKPQSVARSRIRDVATSRLGPLPGLLLPQPGTHAFLCRRGRNPYDRIATITCQFGYAERCMSLQWRGRSRSLAWSNPIAWWWSLLTAVSAINIAAWFSLYHYLQQPRTGNLGSASDIELMLFLCAAYVFGCAFRSFLPRADVQRICLFDTWLSSVTIGRSVATIAEVCFAAQWAMVLHRLGTMTGADTTLSAAWVIVPLILIAECFSWHAVLTKNFLGTAIENSIWGVCFLIIGIGLCRLLPEFSGPASVVLAIAIIGIAGYLAFLVAVDVPMYV